MHPRPPGNPGKRLLGALLAAPLRLHNRHLPAADWQALDPRVRMLCRLSAALRPAQPRHLRRYRQSMRRFFRLGNMSRVPGVAVWDAELPAWGPKRQLQVRHYRPRQHDTTLPGILFLHMGGWVIGDLDTCDSFCSLLAARVPAHVLSIHYRLAPEHRYPAAFMDGFAAYEWLLEQAGNLSIEPRRLAIAGDSAGGSMVLSGCRELRRRGRPQPRLQLAIYPAADLTLSGGSLERYARGGLLNQPLLDWFGERCLHGPHESLHTLASPLRGGHFAGLAPAIIATAGCDPLLDPARRYAECLRRAATPTTQLHYPALPHGFLAMGGIIPAAQQACIELADAARGVLQQ